MVETRTATQPFRSTPPHGRRPDTAELAAAIREFVSIHAPAWEAAVAPKIGQAEAKFRSTPPHGRRPSRFEAHRQAARSFDPRPRMGGGPH